MNKSNQILKKAIEDFNKKNISSAKNLTDQAISLNPNNFDALNSMGVILGYENNHAQAIQYFNMCLKIKPNHLGSIFNLANAFFNLKKYEDSLIYYEKAKTLMPNNFQITFSYAKNLFLLDKYDEAHKYLLDADGLSKNNHEVIYYLGLNKLYLKSYEEALGLFNKCIEYSSPEPDYHHGRGRAYLGIKDPESAMKDFETAISLGSKKLDEVYYHISSTQILKNKNDINANYQDAIKFAKKSIEINPNNYRSMINLAVCYIYERKLNESIEIANRAIDLKTDYQRAYFAKGLAYRYLCDYKSSANCFNKALDLEVNKEDFEYYGILGEVLLMQGQFDKAWEYYEYRKEKNIPSNIKKPEWKKEKGFGKVLILGEQGIGDVILFSTLLEDVINNFEKVYLIVDERLVRILKETFPKMEVYTPQNELTDDDYDYFVSFGTLAGEFRKNISEFPKRNILATPVKNNEYIKDNKKLRCGISWGSSNPTIGKSKSIDIDLLTDILKIDEIDFFSLQYTDVKDDILRLKNKDDIVINLPKNLDTFNEIYKLMQFIDTCDFIISVSNSNVHLSAIMGKPIYLLLPKDIGRLWYWENVIDGKNIWYPSSKIEKFIQEEYNDWEEAIIRLKEQIKMDWKI